MKTGKRYSTESKKEALTLVKYKGKRKPVYPEFFSEETGCLLTKWWRWRESNPRPRILPSRIYMLSSWFKSRLKLSPVTRIA